MGGIISKLTGNNKNAKTEGQIQANWKVMLSTDEARRKFELDGTLPRDCTQDHLELRVLLEEPLAQYTIGQYAKKIKAFNTFLCWVDIQTYKGIPTPDFRRSKALHIFHKYIKQGGIMEIGGVDQALRERYEMEIQVSKTNPDILTADFFKDLQLGCFMDINSNIYQRFLATEEYIKLKAEIKQSYNRVKVDDFDYMKKLGEGGFGLVVHCRKKTTGKHFAMKIQTKKGLLDCYSDDPWRADFEKQGNSAF
jgi:Regulator of G protein signaling domain